MDVTVVLIVVGGGLVVSVVDAASDDSMLVANTVLARLVVTVSKLAIGVDAGVVDAVAGLVVAGLLEGSVAVVTNVGSALGVLVACSVTGIAVDEAAASADTVLAVVVNVV